MLKLILYCLGIFAAKAIEVTFGSLKVIMVTKNKRAISAALAFVESLIWALIVSGIMSDLQSKPWLLVSYCIGNATGYALGSFIENKLALGTVSAQIISSYDNREKISSILDKNNIGYTTTVGEGSKDINCVFTVIIKRKNYQEIIDEIKSDIPDTFIVVNDITKSIGGHGKRIRRR